MTWADFYLVCFVVGVFLSLLMFLAGGTHLHIPHFHGHALPVHIHGAGHAPAAHGGHSGQVSPFNLISLTAFLAWFGGTGYLLTRHSTIWFWAALGISLLSGTGGAAIIYLFLSRVLTSPDEHLDPADFERSEEHTSELQSRQYLVCRLLLEKKNNELHTLSTAPGVS